MQDSWNWEVDHKVPRSVGGSNSYDNLQLVHKACHIEKTRKDQSKYCRRRGGRKAL